MRGKPKFSLKEFYLAECHTSKKQTFMLLGACFWNRALCLAHAWQVGIADQEWIQLLGALFFD